MMKSFGDAAATVNNQDNLMQQQQSVQVKDDDHFSIREVQLDKNKKRKFNDDDMKKTL
ncbi:hypothetical protein POPTR_014G116166v4 [Populus trichocarpa]|uniref:Uncharacterized protein n=1 Tax=Populus trichocarpa TaxID=3694 RepID=A0ACC0RYS5_POPTR|nr:hypothetical protein POPTR_014G116166v4 [Populus trichocarpa]